MAQIIRKSQEMSAIVINSVVARAYKAAPAMRIEIGDRDIAAIPKFEYFGVWIGLVHKLAFLD